MYTIKQTAGMLGVKPRTIKQYITNGWLELGDDGQISQAALHRFNLNRDPDLPIWQKVRAWFIETGAPGISEHTKKQLAVALENRVKPGGYRRAPETARALENVSRERVRYILRQARQAYNETIISGAYDNSL